MDEDLPLEDQKYALVKTLVCFDSKILLEKDIVDQAKKAKLNLYTYDQVL